MNPLIIQKLWLSPNHPKKLHSDCTIKLLNQIEKVGVTLSTSIAQRVNYQNTVLKNHHSLTCT